MGKKKTKALLLQMQSELMVINTRLDMIEQTISHLQDSAVVDSKFSSKLNDRLFRVEWQLCEPVAATKILRYEVTQMKDKLSAIAEVPGENRSHRIS